MTQSAAAHQAIERFLQTSRHPVLLEPGVDPIALQAGNFALTARGEIVTIEAWDERHNVVRRIRRVLAERRGRLEIEVERFGGRAGQLTLADLEHPANREASRRGARLKYRERFRRSLLRQFADWRLVELSTEPDLQHSLSPSYPRGFLRKGAAGLAAIGAAEDALDPDGALTFGLIWLDYLRRRETRVAIQGLAVFVPAGKEPTTCHRVRYLDRAAANCTVFIHHPDGSEDPVDARDYTNFDTKVEPCRQPLAQTRRELVEWVERLAAMDAVERRDQPDGSASLAVRGLEFGRATGETLMFGLDRKHLAAQSRIGEAEALAEGLARMRRAGAVDRENPLYARHPEAWLESQVRANLERIDAALLSRPVYGQVPQFAAGERGICWRHEGTAA